MKDDEWVVLKRYDDGLAAQIALDFLRDHGIRVGIRGNSGATAVLNRFDTVLDVRLVVQQRDLEEAGQALVALEAPPPPPRGADATDEDSPAGHPYRSLCAPKEETMPRYRRAAFALALMVPIGSGHFYARETQAGVVLLSGILACALGAMITQAAWPLAAGGLIVLGDALTAPAAVTRYNAGKLRSPSAQLARAGLLVGVVLGAAFAFLR
jgi:hypothetical protein